MLHELPTLTAAQTPPGPPPSLSSSFPPVHSNSAVSLAPATTCFYGFAVASHMCMYLASFTWHNDSGVHPCWRAHSNKNQDFFLWLDHIFPHFPIEGYGLFPGLVYCE